MESHDLNINNFDVKEIFEEIKASKIQNVDHPMLKSFFDQVISSENRAISLLHNDNLKRYARNKFHEFHKEWIKKIVTADKPIDEIFDEAGETKRKMDAGQLVGVDLPPSLLNHNEHAKLLQKLDFIQDYLDGESIEITTSISVLELIQKSDKYHEEIAKAGKGMQYDRIKQENIAVGPEWDNEEYNGYVIVELKSANDLKVEGFKMNHCVGGENYIAKLKNNTGRIFSFRDIKNLLEPLVTVETDPGRAVIRQIFGRHDSDPDQKFIDMTKIIISNIKIEDLDKLSERDKTILAQNPNTSQKTLEKLSNYDLDLVKSCVAKNPNTNQRTLEKLSNDKDPFIRADVASNPSASLYILDKLADDKADMYGHIIIKVIKNQNTSKETLDRLANSNSHNILKKIIENPNTSQETFKKVSIHKESEIRLLVAMSPNTSPEILEKLSNDKVDYIVKAVASNKNTSQETLEILSNNEDNYIKEQVAKNCNTSKKILEKLSYDQVANVRMGVATNRNTSQEILDNLSNDKVFLIRMLVWFNPSANLKTLEKLYENKVLSKGLNPEDSPVYRAAYLQR